MKSKLYSWYNVVAATILSLLGFSSCGDSNSESPDMYGTPITTYQLKGNVTDSCDAPLENIKVVVSCYDQHTDSTFTDANGNYAVYDIHRIEPILDDNFKVILEDVDGEHHGGTFANDTISGKDITSTKIADGKDAWDMGTYQLNAPTKKLKKK